VRWVTCDAGHRHWGPYGAAGLLIRCGEAYLLQLRAAWTHHGDTWGIPGGARHQGEGSYAAACREAAEEMGPLPPRARLGAFTDDHGGWAYVTYLVATAERFEPRGSAETGEDALGAATTIVNAKVFDGTKSQDWTSVRFADGLITKCSAAGSDYLKIISGTGGLWPSLDPETIQALVIAAHTRGLVVVAHVSSTAGVEEVVSAGVDVVAHVPADAELDKALAGRMAEAGIVVGPTLATIENTLGEPGGAAVVGDPRLAEALGDAWAGRLTSDASGWHGRQMPPYSRAEDNVRRLADAGVTLLAGTDAPNPGTVFGASLHRELELLVRCGISPAQALAAATAEPARVFGLADRGRVAAGQRADLVLVSGDPLTDITATRAIERIWRGGIACDRHAFVASAAEAEQLDAFDAQLAKVVAAVRERWSG